MAKIVGSLGRWGVLLAVVLSFHAGVALANTCDCPSTGPYVDPATVEMTPGGLGGPSPSGRYQATADPPGAQQRQLTITRPGQPTFTRTLTSDEVWGYGPDDDVLITHYVSAVPGGTPQDNITLFNLATDAQVFHDAVPAGSVSLSFSPGGKYFLLAYLQGAGTLNLEIRNARTGVHVYRGAAAIVSNPGTPQSNAWGFSPDERAFVHVGSSGPLSAEGQIVDLAAVDTAKTIDLRPGAFWMFSPCGDVLGVVEQDGQEFVDATAYRVENGSVLGSARDRLSAVTLRATATEHQAAINGTNHRLGANTAGAACPMATLRDVVVVTPPSVEGGTDTTATVRFDRTPPAPIPVTLSVSDPGASGSVPPAASVQPTLTATAKDTVVTVKTTAVTATRRVTIAATAGAVTKSATLDVTPVVPRTVASLTLLKNPVQGGQPSSAEVRLDRPAPPGGVHVTLESQDVPPTADRSASVPPDVRVPAGSVRATFAIGTVTVTSLTTARITARLGASSASADLTINRTPVPANAVVNDPACTQNTLARGDDGSSALLNLGFRVNFFGTTYDQLWVNNNGNLTFDNFLAGYVPFDLRANRRVIVAPFFADVDTRADPESGLVTWGSTAVGGRPAFCANWNGVGYYNTRADKLNTFQALLIDRSDTGAGNFDLQFNYNRIQWDIGQTGNAVSARIGYSNGDPQNPLASFELAGSGVTGTFLDTAPGALIYSSRNSSERGRYVYEVRNGAPPLGGQIAGRVLEGAGVAVSGSQVQACRADGTCVRGRSNTHGDYELVGLANGDYTVTAYPPVGRALSVGRIGPLTIASASTVLSGQDIQLTAPQPPPAGTSVSPSRPGGLGLPSVYWGDSFSIVTQGCPGGSGSFALTLDSATIASGALTEGPAGTYTAQVPALSPNSGVAHVRISITCPGGAPGQTVDFDVYIDPSGTVRTLGGLPIAGATVVLYRLDPDTGSFEVVPAGSDIMSPSNRRNPDATIAGGRFGWDVIAGRYRVRASAAGCVDPDDPTRDYVETPALTIPPPVTDLDLRRACANDVTVAPPRVSTSQPGSAEATVPPTLALKLAEPAQFGSFVPGREATYDASTSGSIISTAGDATLSVADLSPLATGHLVNGAFSLPQPLLARTAAGGYGPVGSATSPLVLRTWDKPVSNDPVTLAFQQRINGTDALRTGSYSKTLTFTLSTTSP